jgi:hypothetical protein
MLLKKEEVERIRAKTIFDENSMQWRIPKFYLKQKEVSLPTIGLNI